MKKIFYLAFFCIISLTAFSQDEAPPDDEGTDIPLDGGVTLLIASGIALGAKKYMSKK